MDSNSCHEDTAPKGFLPVLQNGHFLILWLGQIFSQLADKIYLVLVVATIATHFQGPDREIGAWVSAVMVAFTIPAVLFGSLAGAYVDRWSKKAVLVGTNLMRGLLVWSVPLLLYVSTDRAPWLGLPVGFWMLLAITFLVSTLTQFFAPAEQTTIPLIVRKRDLLPANSLYTTTMMAALILGFAIGEPLLELTDILADGLGLTWSFSRELVVGGSYVLAGLVLLPLQTYERERRQNDDSPHVLQDIWDGICYLRTHHRVRNAMVQLILLFCIFAALAVLAVSLADRIPSLKASQFGFLLAAGGVGMAVGAGFLGTWGDRFSTARLGIIGSAGVAASLAGLALATDRLWLAIALTTALGAFAALVGVPMQTTIQAETPEAMRGKVFGLQNNAVNIALSLPLALAGAAEAVFGLRAVFFGLAALAIAGGLLTWYISRTGVAISART
nr:MFS transporter [Rubidibacter lacunae]